MNTPKISIIVPIYNVEQYLEECIKSIRSQTYRNIQIVLIDDGSTDSSGRICDKHALEDDRIVVVHQKNQGLVAARKAGLKIAKGEYIGFVDGDDYIEPQMYKSMLHVLIRENADMVHTWFSSQTRCENKIIDLDTYRMDVFKRFIGAENSIADVITPSIWSKLFKSNVIRTAYALVEDNVSYGEDFVCVCATIFIAKRICTMDECFYHYRVREDSISHKISIESVGQEVWLYTNICNALKKLNVYEEIKSEMDSFLMKHILFGFKRLHHYEIPISRFIFPSPEKILNKKILLYGAGNVGNDYYSQIRRYTNCEIVAWVDAYPEKYNYPFVEVVGLDALVKVSYDLLLIAIKNKATYMKIKNDLMNRHIPVEKIIWEEPKDITVSEE